MPDTTKYLLPETSSSGPWVNDDLLAKHVQDALVDEFAKAALTGLLASTPQRPSWDVSMEAFKIGEAMLEERMKRMRQR